MRKVLIILGVVCLAAIVGTTVMGGAEQGRQLVIRIPLPPDSGEVIVTDEKGNPAERLDLPLKKPISGLVNVKPATLLVSHESPDCYFFEYDGYLYAHCTEKTP